MMIREPDALPMPLPDTLAVKLSSESAGALSITRVVRQQITADELLERIVSVVGKNPARVRRVLCAGTLLEGATRIRWTELELQDDEIAACLARFPDPDASRRFNPEECTAVVLLDSGGRSLSLGKVAAEQTRLLRRRTFWDALMRLAADESPRYVTYSYRDNADCYQLDVSASAQSAIREAARLLADRAMVRQLGAAHLVGVQFLLPRRS